MCSLISKASSFLGRVSKLITTSLTQKMNITYKKIARRIRGGLSTASFYARYSSIVSRRFFCNPESHSSSIRFREAAGTSSDHCRLVAHCAPRCCAAHRWSRYHNGSCSETVYSKMTQKAHRGCFRWSPSTTTVICASSSRRECRSATAAARCRSATARSPARHPARSAVAATRCSVDRPDRRPASESAAQSSPTGCRKTSALTAREAATTTRVGSHPTHPPSSPPASLAHTRRTN